MKRIENKKNSKRTLFLILGLIVVLLVSSGIAYALFVPKNSSDNSSTNSSPKQESDADKKSDTINSDKDSSTTPPTPTSNNIQVNASLDGSKNIIVTTKLYGVSDGECKLSVTNTNTSTYTAPVIYQSEYSTCAGFTIPTHNQSGLWKLTLSVTSNGVTATQETTVNVQ